MIGTRGAEFREARSIMTVDEAKRGLIGLRGGDDAIRCGQLSTQERKDLHDNPFPLRIRQRRMFLPAKRLCPAIVLFNIGCRLIDNRERSLVAGLVVVAPRTHAVVTKKYTFGFRVFLD